VLPHVAGHIQRLAAHCSLASLPDSNGWKVDVWVLSQAALATLVEAYRVLLMPEIDTRIQRTIADEGVDLEGLLIRADAGSETITRADMTELAAAAAVLRAEGWPLETMLMPNVPKVSRKKSESGMDIMAVRLDPGAPTETLLPHERLLICSVKHTVVSAVDLTTKLIASVKSTALTPAYVLQQLRVLHGRLAEARVSHCDRVWLFASPSILDSPHLELLLTGAIGPSLQTSFGNQMSRLPVTQMSGRLCRHLIIEGLPTLHERV